MVAAAGLVLSLLTAVHLVLIWVPAHFGTVPWEFAAATQTVELLPLSVMGAALLGWAALSRGWRRGTVALSAWCGLLALLSLGVAGLLFLDMPVAWKSVAPQMREGLLKTGGKALVFSALFAVFYAWSAVRLFRARPDAV